MRIRLEDRVKTIKVTGKTLDFESLDRSFNFGVKKENIDLKNDNMHLKETIETYRKVPFSLFLAPILTVFSRKSRNSRRRACWTPKKPCPKLTKTSS